MTTTTPEDAPAYDAVTIDELLSRNPLKLTEEDVNENVRLMVELSREERRIWEEEQTRAKTEATKPSGSRTKAKQRSVERQAAAAQIDLDLGL